MFHYWLTKQTGDSQGVNQIDSDLYYLDLQIEEVRQQTKAEKKRLAMAVRKKQLVALGMTVSCLTICLIIYLFVIFFAKE